MPHSPALAPNGANGPPRVEKWNRELIAERGISADPVLDHDPCDAAFGEPSGIVTALVVGGEDAVSAAGEDQHGRAGGLTCIWQIDLVLGNLDIAQASVGVSFRTGRARLGGGCLAGPQVVPLGGGNRSDDGEDQGDVFHWGNLMRAGTSLIGMPALVRESQTFSRRSSGMLLSASNSSLRPGFCF